MTPRLGTDYSRVIHSLRSASIGSMLAAFRAGITAAIGGTDNFRGDSSSKVVDVLFGRQRLEEVVAS